MRSACKVNGTQMRANSDATSLFFFWFAYNIVGCGTSYTHMWRCNMCKHMWAHECQYRLEFFLIMVQAYGEAYEGENFV